MRILLVSQMYPSPSAPEFGIFVADVARELERRGHELAYVVPSGRGGSPTKHVRMAAEAVRTARSFRPDVVYARGQHGARRHSARS
jgi:predicted fused transcriptional regulator/phosphomethylpyrimidine kinase